MRPYICIMNIESNRISKETYDLIIAELKAKAEDYKQQYNFHLSAAAKNKDEFERIEKDILIFTNPPEIKPKQSSVAKPTFNQWVVSQFGDETPKTSRQLFDLYVAEFGGVIDMHRFSAYLSMATNKAKIVRKFDNESKDLKQRFYYGLPEWFDGGLMKDVYINMIKYENSK